MTIKTKLLVNVLLPVGTLAIIILVMISLQNYRYETERANDAALALLSDMLKLSQRTDDYLLLGEEQARTGWHEVDASVSALMDQLHFKDERLNPILERIQRNLQEMRNLFSDAAPERILDPLQHETEERQKAREILAKAEDVSSDALVLFDLSRADRKSHALRLHVFMLAFFLLSLLVSAGSLIPINRSIASAIGKLTSGTGVVGSGNLDHKIDLKGSDELGLLARAFNAMTDSLKVTTVSRDALAREVAQRTEAEEKLRKARDDLDVRVHERTEELQQAYDKLKNETEERGRVERQLRHSQKMEAIGTLAGGISHDFNNVLAAIIGFSEMSLAKTPEGSPGRGHMERVLAAGIRGRNLVRQILAFSRRAEQEKLPLKLAPVVKEALMLLRPSLPSTIDIRTNLRRDVGFVLADPTQMQQILMNLCTNAAYAMRRKGGSISIDVTTSSFPSPGDMPDPAMTHGPYVRLSVADTGEGMPPETIEHIFDPFFTTKATGEGTGLGLSAVHGIVASHGGVITVSSEPGKGSVFAVYLPELAKKQPLDSPDDGGPIPHGHERILLVDDEEDLAAIGDEILTDLGYHVISKTGAREALALFRLDPSQFDLVITDQTMPGITGEEFVKEVLLIRADVPVILCTGFNQTFSEESAHAAGIRKFIMKPLTKREIATVMREVLDG